MFRKKESFLLHSTTVGDYHFAGFQQHNHVKIANRIDNCEIGQLIVLSQYISRAGMHGHHYRYFFVDGVQAFDYIF